MRTSMRLDRWLRPTTCVALLTLAGAASAQPTKFQEAPMLAEQVKAGKLPPVEKRLPADPLVVPVVERTGQYGGVWRRAFLGPADSNNYVRVVYDALVRFSPDGAKIEPKLAAGWESSRDFRTWTIKLRQGARWSDGAPFTADDILFWYQDVLLNKDLVPALPSWIRNADGTPATVEKVSPTAVRWTYKQPNTLLLTALANQDGGDRTYAVFLPAHYLKKFHPTYTKKDEVDKLVAAAGFKTWTELFAAGDARQRPGLHAETQSLLRRRGPEWEPAAVSRRDPLHVLRRHPGPESGGHRRRVRHARASHTDDELSRLQGEREDREVPRDHVADVRRRGCGDHDQPDLQGRLGYRQAHGHQGVPSPWHPYYPGDQYARKYTQYNPDRANKTLDQLGLSKRDADGTRLLPSGKRVVLELSVVPAFAAWPDVAQLVAKDWEKVGVKTVVQLRERALHFKMRDNNELMTEMWNEDTTGFPFTGNAKFDPRNSPILTLGPLYGRWAQTKGAEGVEPPASIKRIMEIVDQAKTIGPEQQAKLAQELFRIWVDNLWEVGTVGLTPMVQGVVVTNARFRNVPTTLGNDWPLRSPGNARVEQFFFTR